MPPTDIGTGEQERGVIQLVEAIFDDTRDLLGAHVDALRGDVKEGLSSLGATVASSVAAFSILIVTALLCGISLAMTLALAVPVWVAFWIVTLAAGALGFGLVLRVRREARSAGRAAAEVAERVKEDVAALQLATSDDT